MGCFAKGCLILVAFFILLGLAFIGGTWFAVRYLRGEYFPRTSMQLPPAASTEQEQQLALTNWRIFEAHARAHEPAHLELTGDDVNALIAAEPALSGKAHVSIEGDVAHLQISVPLDQVRWLHGHYMNGECTVRSGLNADPRDIRITNIVVNGRPVAIEAVQWRYGPWSVRRYIHDWAHDQNIKTFEIRDGRVILDTGGS